MVKFLSIRIIVYSIVLATATFLFDGFRMEISVGVVAGAAVAIYKIRRFSASLALMVQAEEKKTFQSFTLNFFSQAMTLVILVTAIKVDMRFFIGVVIGLLATVFVICLNMLTEVMGLTHNQWQDCRKKD